ncbi:hypothetical protein LX36DRAFT_295140 [Colletotrichum falcatum]|nr:hypothetical protein LX36DRAFT_295140 [Colletotrichum falcatum]
MLHTILRLRRRRLKLPTKALRGCRDTERRRPLLLFSSITPCQAQAWQSPMSPREDHCRSLAATATGRASVVGPHV